MAPRHHCAISPSDAAPRSSGRRSVSSSLNRHERTVPSAVIRVLSQFSQNGRVTDAMMTAAATAVATTATIHTDPHGALLPERAHLADTATAVARAVARAAVRDQVAPPRTDAEIDQAFEEIMRGGVAGHAVSARP